MALALRWKRYRLKDDLGNVIKHESIAWAWDREKRRIITYVWHLEDEEPGLWHVSVWRKETHLESVCYRDVDQEHAEDLALSFIDGILHDPYYGNL